MKFCIYLAQSDLLLSPVFLLDPGAGAGAGRAKPTDTGSTSSSLCPSPSLLSLAFPFPFQSLAFGIFLSSWPQECGLGTGDSPRPPGRAN